MRLFRVDSRRFGLFASVGAACAVLCVAALLAGCSRRQVVRAPVPPTPAPARQAPAPAAQQPPPPTRRFDAARSDGRTGKIVVPFKGEAFLYLYRTDTQKPERRRLTSKDGVFEAPPGKYQLLTYYVLGMDGGRRVPVITGQYRRPFTITVSSGSTQRIKAGPPFAASIEVAQRGADLVTMNLLVTGRGGEQCRFSSKEPGFKVLSRSGQVLQEGKFRFG